MASKEEIQKKNIEEANSALADQISLVNQIQDKMTFLIKSSKDKYTQDKLALDLTKQAVSFTQKLASEYESVKDVEKDIAKQKKLQNEVARQQITLQKEIGKEGQKRIQFIKNQEKGLASSAQKLAEMRAAEAAGVKGAKEQAEKLAASLYSRTKSLNTQKENLSVEEKQLMLLDETSAALEGNNAHLDEQLKRQENLVKSQSLFTSAIGGASKALAALGFGDLGKKLGLDAASKKAKDMIYTLTDGGKKSLGIFGKMKVGIATFGSALKSALGPLALIGMATSLFQKFKEKGQEALNVQREYNQQMVDMQRSLGVSTGTAAKLYAQTQGVGRAMGLTADQAAAAGTAIYGQLDGVEKLGNATMGVFMKLNAHGGVSAETLGKIYQMSKLSGKEAGTVADNIAKTAQQSIKSLKLNVSMRAIMDGVANTSNRLKISMGGSATAITKAVAQAKKLGLEMAGVESVMDSLLNIEDSIAAEMEAELLTGQELNLEKARAAALNNDAATVAEELAAQGITQEKFAGMNRIQQEAIAKAMGMSATDMADMLNNSAKNKSENQELLETQKQGAKAMMGAASAMEAFAQAQKDAAAAAGETGETFAKYEEAMLKLQTAMGPILDAILVPIGEIVTGIVEKMADWLSDTKNVEMITNVIKTTFETLGNIFMTLWEIFSPLFDAIVNIAEMLLPKIYDLFMNLKPVFVFLAETIGKVAEFIVGMVLSVTDFIGKLFDANAEFSTMEKIIGTIAFVLGGMIAISKTILGIEKARKFIQEATNKEKQKEYMLIVKNSAAAIKDFFKSMGGAIAKIFSGFAQIPFGLGIPLAIGAAATLGTMAYSYFNKGDDVVSEGGYGKRTLFGPEGAISLNDKDDVIAGTDLFNKKSGGGGGGDNSAMVAELQRVSSLLQQILNKEGGVYIDGNKVGATIALSNYQQQ